MTDWEEQEVVDPVTGEEHTVEGPPATMCPTRETAKHWIRQLEEKAATEATCVECGGDTTSLIGGEYSICDDCRDEMLTELLDEHNIVVVDDEDE